MSLIGALLGLAGGLGLFIYGMHLCSNGLQKLAGYRLKQWVKKLTGKPFCGLIVGIVVTFGLQSSSATSALLIGFVSAGLMALPQTMGVLLGSALGASLTAQLIAFKITGFALISIFSGVFLYLFSKRLRLKYIGQTVLGFGILFFGMSLMSSSMAPVRDYPVVARIMTGLEYYPVLEFLVAFLGTAIIQSSPAFLALLMTLGTHGLIGASAIVPFVLGAHLGGTVTGILLSIGVPGREAKRVAMTNFGFKLINGLAFLPFYQFLTGYVLWSSTDFSREIANTHTLFSLVMAVGFLPFGDLIAKLMKRLIPDAEAKPGEEKYLDETLLASPEMAIVQAHRQTLEMGRIIGGEMLNRVIPAVRFNGDEILEMLAQTESAVDTLYTKISRYVSALGGNNLPDVLMQRVIQILYTVNDLEHIGDIIMIITQNVRKIRAEELRFSEEGLTELEEMFNLTSAHYNQMLKAFENLDESLALRVIKEYPKIQRLEKELRFNHFDRMQSGNVKTEATSAVHLDLLESMLRIDSHTKNISQVIIGMI